MGDAGELARLRDAIDDVDRRLVELLNERARVSVAIGQAKKRSNHVTAEVHAPSREASVFERVSKLNKGPLPDAAIRAVYREVMSASIALQQPTTIAFLGPPGTFSHAAATDVFGESVTYAAQGSIAEVVRTVESGTATYGVVPWANSCGGLVAQTADALGCFGGHVRAETFVAVTHALLSNAPRDRITRIYSHPEALVQCSHFLSQSFPHAELVPTASTAAAAAFAAEHPDHSAAIASPRCAEEHALHVVVSPINDDPSNTTRFFIIGRQCEVATGADRTVVAFVPDFQRPSALADALGVFRTRQVRLMRIDARPVQGSTWRMRYYLELLGHITEAHVLDAITQLQHTSLEVRVLGSFPEKRHFARQT